MGFLKGAAVRLEAKRLQPFMRSDEHFLETDVCELVTVEWRDGLRQGGGQVALSLTSRALYMRPTKGGSDMLRIPWERCIDLAGARGMIEIVTMQASYLIRQIGRPMSGSDTMESIRLHMERVERHREWVEVPGGKVLATFRPLDEGDEGQWTFRMTEGVDLKDEEVKQAVLAKLQGPLERYGTPPVLSQGNS